MKSSRAVLFPIGVEGQFYQIKAFQEVFSAPVAVVFFTEVIEALYETLNFAKPDRVYSFPKYYKKHKQILFKESIGELRSEISSYEKKYKISSSSKLYFSDRYLRRENSWPIVIRRIAIIYRFVDHVLSQEDPIWLKSGFTTMLGLVFHSAAVSKGIPSLSYQTGRVNDIAEILDETWMGTLRGWTATFENIQKNGRGVVDEKIVNTASLWLKDFLNKPMRPQYSEKNSVLYFNARSFLKNILDGILVRFTSKYWSSLLRYKTDREFNFRAPFGEAFVRDFLFREFRSFFLRRSKYFRQNADMGEPFIYFPLQYTPEISTTTYAIPNDDQCAIITALAKSIPGNTRIFVKEHTSMIGRRSRNFYKTLSKLYNVKIISPTINTFDLIENAVATATLNGNAGWEAFLFGKPVIAFGEAFYKEFPGILRLEIGCNMDRKIRKYLDEFEPNKEQITDAVIAYFDVLCESKTGDIGDTVQQYNVESNALNLAKDIKKQFERFPIREPEKI